MIFAVHGCAWRLVGTNDSAEGEYSRIQIIYTIWKFILQQGLFAHCEDQCLSGQKYYDCTDPRNQIKMQESRKGPQIYLYILARHGGKPALHSK